MMDCQGARAVSMAAGGGLQGRWWTLRVLVVVAALAVVEASKQRGAPHLDEGAACVTMDGGPGVCRLLTQCPHQQAGHQPKTCRFQETTPIVCCGGDSAPGDSRPLQPHEPSSSDWTVRSISPSAPPDTSKIPGKILWNARSDAPKPKYHWDPLPSNPVFPGRPGRIHWGARPSPPNALPVPGKIHWYPETTPFPSRFNLNYPLPPTTAPTRPVSMMSMTSSQGERSTKACKEYSEEMMRMHVLRIFNGRAALEGKFPHMALLGYIAMGQNNLTWNCGGALISRRYVLTAAHCFSDRILKTPVRVRLGEHDLRDNEDNAVDFNVKRWVLHPQYRTSSWYHDLALIELDREAKFSRYIQPACLWAKPQDPSSEFIVTGWGGTQQKDGPMSNILLEGAGTLKRVESDVCTKYYQQAITRLKDGPTEGILCIVDDVGSVDTCQGDSGGPVQVESMLDISLGSVPAYFVVGVVSSGTRLCGSRVPSINTRVYQYLDWIENEVWRDNC